MKRLTAKLLPALLLLTLMLAACLLPPFDRGLSLAQATARKLKLEARIGPLYHWRGDLERGRHYFLPGKTRGLNRGFLLVFSSYDGRVFYIDYDSLTGYGMTGEQSFQIMNYNENLFNYGAWVLKVKDPLTVDDALLLVRPNMAGEQRLEFQYVAGAGLTPHAYDLSAFTSGITGGQVVGVGLFPDSATTDFLTTLVNEGGTSNYYDRVSAFAFDTLGYTLTWPPSAVPAPGIPGSPLQGFYFRNPAATGLRFLSAWNGSGYANYRWTDTSPPAALPFDSRIEALLSTDELFVVDEEQAVIYSPAGEPKYRFPLGALHFAYENYIGGVPTLLFSLIYWDQVGGDNEKFHINVYSLPTARLSTLD